MEEQLFTLHFGYSNSRRYAQARELANLCCRHVVTGEGRNVWHRVTFTGEQIDLMASLYDLARGFFYPRIYDAPAWSMHAYLENGRYEYAYATPGQRRRVREAGERLKAAHGGDATAALAALTSEILHPIVKDLRAVSDALLAKRYLVFQSHTDPQVRTPKRPRECHPAYAAVRQAIDDDRLVEAVDLYYQALGDKPFGELHPELLYLKRLAVVPLLGRDILAFRNPSPWTDLIKGHLEEYCTCINATVQAAMSAGRESPLNVLSAGVPTLAELIERTEQRYHRRAYLWDPPYDRIKLDQTVVTAQHFGQFTCPTGRLFDRYVNPLVYHWSGDEMEEYVFEKSVWTVISPEFVEREIIAKDLTLAGIVAGKMRDRRATIDTFTDPSQVKFSQFAVSGIRYTGRVRRMLDVTLYEADLLRNDIPKAGVGSCLHDWAGEILREAENLLRERHGLPRIGEGWVSETLLFTLVQEVFPDAIQHARPRWLRPQHLDIFVPSVHLAIEYQGRQHFEPMLDLLQDKIEILTQRDHPLDYVVLVLPYDLYNKCRVANYTEKGIGKVHRDLHRAFKAMAMKFHKPTQILQETTTGLTPTSRQLDHKSTIAWNLFTGLYFKADGLPCGPTGLPPASCLVGVSFFRPLDEAPSTLRTSVVQAFDENGEGLVLRGHSFPWDEEKQRRSPHLSEEMGGKLIEMVLDRYQEERKQLPQRVVVHKSSRFEPSERAGFEQALSKVNQYDLVALFPTSEVRLVRAGRYPPLRGTAFRVGDVSYLYTSGYLATLGGYPHGHVPSPLQIADHVGDTSRTQLLREIMVLTKMNWNSADFSGLMPITLRFSRLVGNILREVPADETPQPKYKYYM